MQQEISAQDEPMDNALTTPSGSKLKLFSSRVFVIGSGLVLAVLVFLAIVGVLPIRDISTNLYYRFFPASSWQAAASAEAVCEASTGNINLDLRFVNNENTRDEWCIRVNATDTQTQQTVDLGPVVGGDTQTGTIRTGANNLSSGQVRFDLRWCDGRPGDDVIFADYFSKRCVTPTPTAIPTPTLTPTPSPLPGDVTPPPGKFLDQDTPTPTPIVPTLPSSGTPGSTGQIGIVLFGFLVGGVGLILLSSTRAGIKE